MKRISALTLTAGLLVGAMACETSTSETPLPDPSAVDPLGSWSLLSFELASGDTIPIPDPESYTLELAEDGRAHIRADCNVCNGGYELSDSSLSFGLLACTLAACPPGSLESNYMKALGSVSTFERSGNMLTLVYEDGRMRFQSR